MKIGLRGPARRASVNNVSSDDSKSHKTPQAEQFPPSIVANAPLAPIIDKRAIVVIDQRVLIRDCLVRCLKAANENYSTVAFSSVPEWLAAASGRGSASVVILYCGQSETQVERDLRLVARNAADVPTVVLADSDDPDHVVAALNNGARGYLSTSVTLDVAVEAVRLVSAGGTYVPASSLMAWSAVAEPASVQRRRLAGLFTERQAAVVEALQHGKANKQIAYELRMREGTVKVHVRNIMRKLKAKNRTEVAVLTSGLLANPGGA